MIFKVPSNSNHSVIPKQSDKCYEGTQEQAAANLSALHTTQEFFSEGIRSIAGLFITSPRQELIQQRINGKLINISISLLFLTKRASP